MQVAARRVDPAALAHQPGQVEPGLDEAGVELDGAVIVVRRLELPAHRPQAIGAVEGGDGVARVDGEAALVARRRLVVVPLRSRPPRRARKAPRARRRQALRGRAASARRVRSGPRRAAHRSPRAGRHAAIARSARRPARRGGSTSRSLPNWRRRRSARHISWTRIRSRNE